MTGGGDLDEIQHEDLLDETAVPDDDDDDDDEEDDEDDDDDDEIRADATADGLADVPVRLPILELIENDPDPTAGASDIGGVAGGIESDPDDR